MPNQYLPNPDPEDLREHIHEYWIQRKPDTEILKMLLEEHIDTTKYGLGIVKFREMRKSLGFIGPRGQKHDINSIHEVMVRLRQQYPKAGAREMVNLLFHEEKMCVSRNLISEYFHVYEPELVKERRKNRLRRKRFWSAGANDLWAVDQHDKWKVKFGLALHTGIDPFIGKIHWLKVWWTNSNPRLILSYYLDTVEELGAMPLVTQSDPGNENYGIANGHTALRHAHDPSLSGTIQHRWMNKTKNIPPEISWSQLRRRFTPGFEDTLDIGVFEGWYDPDNPLEALIFRFVFIPWLQAELDAYCKRVNNTAKRADRNKVLPHGVPNDMFKRPRKYGMLDFKVKVEPEHIETVRNRYAPRDHEVFQLVPPDFAAVITQLYSRMGSPQISRQSCWAVYLQLLNDFKALDGIYRSPGEIDRHWGYTLHMAQDTSTDGLELIPNLNPLRGGDAVIGSGGFYYMGGVNNGEGLDIHQSRALEEMVNEDEPSLEPDIEDDFEITVFFPDEADINQPNADEW